MTDSPQEIGLRDATLREGLDVPGVSFDEPERVRIAAALADAGVIEAEVVAPARVCEDVSVARALRASGVPLRLSGLVYANRDAWRPDLDLVADALDRVDLLMPLSTRRQPFDLREKAARLEQVLAEASGSGIEIGAGLPHALQVGTESVVDIAGRAAAAGATRITLYDTNGGADPSAVAELVRRTISAVDVAVYFHGHNDLGLATANALAAVRSGAHGLDVTVNGLGDRAGNASLEQLVVLLRLEGATTGVDPGALQGLSHLVEELSGVRVSELAPVVGRFAFAHKSPGHPEHALSQFEAFSPELIGRQSRLAHE